MKNLWLRLNTLAFGRPLKKIDRQAKANFLCCSLFINLISVTLAKNISTTLSTNPKKEWKFFLTNIKMWPNKKRKKSISWHFVVQRLTLLFKMEVGYFFNWNSYMIIEEICNQLLCSSKNSAVIFSADKYQIFVSAKQIIMEFF